jgi:hypothetical protein
MSKGEQLVAESAKNACEYREGVQRILDEIGASEEQKGRAEDLMGNIFLEAFAGGAESGN